MTRKRHGYFTPAEVRVLQALLNLPNPVDKETINEAACDGRKFGASGQPVISRLRKKCPDIRFISRRNMGYVIAPCSAVTLTTRLAIASEKKPTRVSSAVVRRSFLSAGSWPEIEVSGKELELRYLGMGFSDAP